MTRPKVLGVITDVLFSEKCYPDMVMVVADGKIMALMDVTHTVVHHLYIDITTAYALNAVCAPPAERATYSLCTPHTLPRTLLLYAVARKLDEGGAR